MKHYVLCLVDADEAAQEITQRVANAGFAQDEIFVLSTTRKEANDPADRREAEADNREREGIGLLAGIGPNVVAGTSRFMGNTTIMGPLEGEEPEEGAELLGRFDLSEAVAKQYQTRLTEGGILIAVQTHDEKKAASVRKIFEEAHAQEIS